MKKKEVNNIDLIKKLKEEAIRKIIEAEKLLNEANQAYQAEKEKQEKEGE